MTVPRREEQSYSPRFEQAVPLCIRFCMSYLLSLERCLREPKTSGKMSKRSPTSKEPRGFSGMASNEPRAAMESPCGERGCQSLTSRARSGTSQWRSTGAKRRCKAKKRAKDATPRPDLLSPALRAHLEHDLWASRCVRRRRKSVPGRWVA